ncbi:MAG: hypothetical protein IT425_00930 [Pirellulales bacterium]|nr:hypothetical protein [Pirellulales bacterium]
MLPRTRLFVKKRGARSTGSPGVAKFASAALSVLMLALGILGLWWLIEHVASSNEAGWWPWVAMLIPVALIAYGTVALAIVMWQQFASTERRAAAFQKATEWEFPGSEQRPAHTHLPTVPAIDTVTDSPGVRLSHRLPQDAVAGWRAFSMVVICLSWNVLVAVFLLQVIKLHLAGEPNWLLTALVVPFVVGGIWTLATLAKMILVHLATGATLVEVSQHPFYPGGTFHGFLSQPGRLQVRWLQVQLICEEQAVFQQGTDTRRATCQVYRDVLYSKRKFEIGPQQSLEATFDIALPATAMHSFASAHNAVVWALLVRGRLVRWGDFERRFPVFVYPLRTAAATGSSSTTPSEVSSR